MSPTSGLSPHLLPFDLAWPLIWMLQTMLAGFSAECSSLVAHLTIGTPVPADFR